jgi:hypothetical protein
MSTAEPETPMDAPEHASMFVFYGDDYDDYVDDENTTDEHVVGLRPSERLSFDPGHQRELTKRIASTVLGAEEE